MPDPATVERPWLASYPPGVPHSYPYPEVPVTRLLDDAAKDFPDSVALEFLGATLTYRELGTHVDRFATALCHLGVEKGDRVGVVLPNCPQHVIALFAALRIGAVVTEHNPVGTGEQLEKQVNDAGCKVLVVLDRVYRKVAARQGRLPTVEHVVVTGLADYLPGPRRLLFRLRHRNDEAVRHRIADTEGVKRFTDLVRHNAPTVTQAPLHTRREPAALLYTGGTTGLSKGVTLTHHNLVSNAFQARLWVPDIQAGAENVLCVIPFSHAYGLTACLTLGILSAATLTLLPRFDRAQVLRAIDKRRPTLFPGVPTVFAALSGSPDVDRYDLSSIRVCLSAAAPLPTGAARAIERLTGGKLREGYGLTEASPLTHGNPIYGKSKRGSIGLPVPDTVCVLLDPDDPARPAPPGGPGQLAIAGPQVMAGYDKQPETTAEVLRDGWLLTGDIATVDEDGYFAIVGRKSTRTGGADSV
ncbi:MAG: AMP-binding protein [Euzebyales bacterium]|nr:AMP-binding protein [Euzebyales bacterium]